MPIDFESIALLMAVAGLAGFIDAISGGGGLLTIPALLWVGLPPLQALGTNKLQAVFGSLASSLHFILKGELDPRPLLWVLACTFVGSSLGTLCVEHLGNQALQGWLPMLLLGFALYFLFSPRADDLESRQRIGLPLFGLGAGFGIGFYDGFFGPGAGAFYTLAAVSLLGFGLTKASMQARLLNFTSNFASLLVFGYGGQLLWTLGLPMALTQMLGAWLGARLVLQHGSRLIRPLLVLVSVLLAVKLLWVGR